MFGFLLNAALCGLNLFMYAGDHDPFSLAVAVFCGLGAIFCAVIAR